MDVLDVLDSSDVAQASCSCSKLAYVPLLFGVAHVLH
jgi:hypothetical protein